ncbi:MAG: cysteine desulfurase NifS [Clostridia bacterium]|nr:cysteine desulfurase NifS [Clostridia bacterium]
MNRIYMDNAATTRVTEPVFEAMKPYFCDLYGNPSSVHAFGREARRAVEEARRQVAAALGCEAREVYFTGCGTESDNWAIKGCAYAAKNGRKTIVSTNIEHHAVLHTLEALEKEGFNVIYVPVDEEGIVKMDEMKKAITEDTLLVTVMAANNEIGTIQPIEEIASLAHEKGALFHTDAVQAIGSMRFNVKEMGIDMLSLSGHKFHAPKGVGVLYIKNGLRIRPLIAGGAQERTQRAGTENLASIVALGKAITLANENIDEHNAKLSEMRDALIEKILTRIPETRLNGHKEKRLPGNVNVSISYIEGEALLLSLDLKGIAASSGSACTSGSLDPSHVLLAIGLPHEIAHGSLRLSLSEENTMEEVDYVVDALEDIVKRLRAMSPLYNG